MVVFSYFIGISVTPNTQNDCSCPYMGPRQHHRKAHRLPVCRRYTRTEKAKTLVNTLILSALSPMGLGSKEEGSTAF